MVPLKWYDAKGILRLSPQDEVPSVESPMSGLLKQLFVAGESPRLPLTMVSSQLLSELIRQMGG